MKTVLAIGVALLLSGCANWQQVVSGFNSAAATQLRSAQDLNIDMWRFNACATPYSAAIRNPEIIPALKILCLPAGADSDPSTLFDGVRK